MGKNLLSFLFVSALTLGKINPAQAKLVQILHTNDTHSYLDQATHRDNLGGSARLKSLIDYYKQKGLDEGVKTLVMDAGDFTEGNIYYLAENGRKVFEVHNQMGYDVGALGNHDYLMGTHDLDKILGEMDMNFPFLCANLAVPGTFKNIQEKIKPYKEFDIDGIKIAVFGLTTNDFFYSWRFENVKVSNPYKAARKYEELLKKRNDFIIALTHIGVLNDIKLAERTKFVDLIVGGHSHTALYRPSYGINKNKIPVPVVQAGMHTEYLGRIVVDLNKGQPLKIVSYELVPVKYEAVDTGIKALVDEANNDLDNTYGKEWLDRKVGYSDLRATDKEGSRKWAYFITDALREKAGADIAIHTPPMNGENFPVGSVTRRDLINSIPRVFDLNEKLGWSIYTTKIKGVWLRAVFEALSHFGQPLTFSGISMDFKRTEHGIRTGKVLVNGKPINPWKYYSVAFTEGIVRGAQGVSPYTTAILRNPKNTKLKIWATLEEKLQKTPSGAFGAKVDDDNHMLIMPNLNAELAP